jgi:hypothetical protein
MKTVTMEFNRRELETMIHDLGHAATDWLLTACREHGLASSSAMRLMEDANALRERFEEKLRALAD